MIQTVVFKIAPGSELPEGLLKHMLLSSSLALPGEFLLLLVWQEAWEFVFLVSSQEGLFNLQDPEQSKDTGLLIQKAGEKCH